MSETHARKNTKEYIKTVYNIMYYVLQAWTVGLLVLFATAFIGPVYWDKFQMIIPSVAVSSYIELLTACVLSKEAQRWIERREYNRYGEYFVLVWWIGLFVMIALEAFHGAPYKVPEGMHPVCAGVLSNLFLSVVSQSMFEHWKK